MSSKRVYATRTPFRKIIATTPVLIVSDNSRWAVMMLNEGPADVYIGSSGLTTANGMLLANAKSFVDDVSKDNWWAVAASSSGTLSGFELV